MGRGKKQAPVEEDASVQEIYIVQKLLDKKEENGGVKYLVKWLDYDIKDSSWEPIENLNTCSEVIEEYEELQKAKKKCK